MTRVRWLLFFLLPLLTSCADGLFYWPNDHEYDTLASIHPQGEELWLTSADGTRIHAWWLPAHGKPRGTVVFCHGNNTNITGHAHSTRWLPRRGFDVLLFDYRGYGKSEGSPTRRGTVEDAKAAIDFALQRDPDRTVVFGHSLGGAIGIVAAAQRPAVRAVVAESTFPTYREIAAHKVKFLGFLALLIVSSGCDPSDWLDELAPRPILVTHGGRDRIVPLWFGQALYDRAREPKRLFISEQHGHRPLVYRHGEHYERLVTDFFTAAIAGEPIPELPTSPAPRPETIPSPVRTSRSN